MPLRVTIMPIQRTESSIYQSYLVRFSYDQAAKSWRAAVQSSATQEVQHFATLEAAWAFLLAQLTAASDQRDRPDTEVEQAVDHQVPSPKLVDRIDSQ